MLKRSRGPGETSASARPPSPSAPRLPGLSPARALARKPSNEPRNREPERSVQELQRGAAVRSPSLRPAAPGGRRERQRPADGDRGPLVGWVRAAPQGSATQRAHPAPPGAPGSGGWGAEPASTPPSRPGRWTPRPPPARALRLSSRSAPPDGGPPVSGEELESLFSLNRLPSPVLSPRPPSPLPHSDRSSLSQSPA